MTVKCFRIRWPFTELCNEKSTEKAGGEKMHSRIQSRMQMRSWDFSKGGRTGYLGENPQKVPGARDTGGRKRWLVHPLLEMVRACCLILFCFTDRPIPLFPARWASCLVSRVVSIRLSLLSMSVVLVWCVGVV